MSAGFDPASGQGAPLGASDPLERLDLRACMPLVGMHLACLGALWTGVSATALVVTALVVYLRGFGIAAGYHRLLAHRAFRTSRPFQFVLAYLGCAAAQLGPLWWVAHHHTHHKHSDSEADVHSPSPKGGWRGLYWAHIGWLLCRKHTDPSFEAVRDLERLPELRWLERYAFVAPLSFAVALYALGAWLGPTWNTSGPQMLVWAFFIGTVYSYHATFAINSIGHRFGYRRWDIADDSRNNVVLAALTWGEGFQNNHHCFAGSASASSAWWELDPCYWALCALERIGVVWDVKHPPASRRPAQGRSGAQTASQ